MISICTSVKPDFKVVEEYLKDNFKTAQLSNFGPCYDRLVDELSVFLSLPADKKIVLTSSGHTALMAAYAVSLRGGYDKVYGPAYTFPSTWLAVPEGVKYIPYDEVNWMCMFDTVFAMVAPLSVIPDLKEHHHMENISVFDGAATFGTKGI